MNPFPFNEYAYVTKHSRQLAALHLLHDIILDREAIEALVADLTVAAGLTAAPTLKLHAGKRTSTARSYGAATMQSGSYWTGTLKMAVPSSAHVVVHEMAHHAMYMRPRSDADNRKPPSSHGADFTAKLDYLARLAVGILAARVEVRPAAARRVDPNHVCQVQVRKDRGAGKAKPGQTRFHYEPCSRPAKTPGRCPRHEGK